MSSVQPMQEHNDQGPCYSHFVYLSNPFDAEPEGSDCAALRLTHHLASPNLPYHPSHAIHYIYDNVAGFPDDFVSTPIDKYPMVYQSPY